MLLQQAVSKEGLWISLVVHRYVAGNGCVVSVNGVLEKAGMKAIFIETASENLLLSQPHKFLKISVAFTSELTQSWNLHKNAYEGRWLGIKKRKVKAKNE